MPNISGLATKTSLNSYLQTSAFNSKVTEVENKIKAVIISSVKWGHLAHLDPNSTNTILSTNPMGSSSPL